MERRKMEKTASVLDVIFKIAQIFVTITAVIVGFVLLGFGLFTLISPEKLMTFAWNTLHFGELSLVLVSGQDVLQPELALPQLAIAVATALFDIAIAWVSIRLIREILGHMKAGEPFASGISNKIKQLGKLVLITGAIGQIATVVFETMFYGSADLFRLFNPLAVARYSIDYSFDLTFAGVALFLFLLAYIFRYGEALQKESDETL